jgi:uncharacterized membrane protein YphA (DoxX/SURF4 family)
MVNSFHSSSADVPKLGHGRRKFKARGQRTGERRERRLKCFFLRISIRWAEHVFPVLILIGLATRFSALALLGMTATIQFLVYPDAYPMVTKG